jgi:hypothetical protein
MLLFNSDNDCENRHVTLSHQKRRIVMAKKEKPEMDEPKGQKIFDNIWLLFVLSLLISGVIYNVWGIIDLMNVPIK